MSFISIWNLFVTSSWFLVLCRTRWRATQMRKNEKKKNAPGNARHNHQNDQEETFPLEWLDKEIFHFHALERDWSVAVRGGCGEVEVGRSMVTYFFWLLVMTPCPCSYKSDFPTVPPSIFMSVSFMDLGSTERHGTLKSKEPPRTFVPKILASWYPKWANCKGFLEPKSVNWTKR